MLRRTISTITDGPARRSKDTDSRRGAGLGQEECLKVGLTWVEARGSNRASR